MTSSLERVRDELVRLERFPATPYRVPGIWLGSASPIICPSASRFFLDAIDRIIAGAASGVSARQGLQVMYNAMVRHVTSYDHGTHARMAGWRSTGTFLKMIALLPYLQSLQVGTIVLLPINPIGSVGRKGQLGSPYAVRDPFAVEELLAEPLLNLTPEQQARAFVEAAHQCGMRVVTEVVLRTASLDSVLVEDHPEWFYWIRGDDDGAQTLSAPVFPKRVIREIHQLVASGRRDRLPEPSPEFRRRFTDPPALTWLGHDRWRGRSVDGEEVMLPGAFADWPPDDPQPAWDDVTYLKLHHHPTLNYMAYNTIRMFDESLEQPGMENIGVWNLISAIIPTAMRMLDVDGAMVDMGHALPGRLRRSVIDEARHERPSAIMIEENFHLDESSVSDGFDIVSGYLPFAVHDIDELHAFVERLSTQRAPVRFFACGESHNTPRWASRAEPDLVPALWAFLSLLPKAVPFIVAGMELSETRPINTGLSFSADEISTWTTDRLALFSDVPLEWDTAVDRHALFVSQLEAMGRLDILRRIGDDDRVDKVACAETHIVAFHRQCVGTPRGMLVILNTSAVAQQCILDVSGVGIAALAVSDQWTLLHRTIQCHASARSVVIIPTFLAP